MSSGLPGSLPSGSDIAIGWGIGLGTHHVSYGAAVAEIVPDAGLQGRLDTARRNFDAALDQAVRPLASPTAVTQEAAEPSDEEIGLDTQRAQKAAGGRFGHVFGSAVHRAIELLLSGASNTAAAAVTLAAQEAKLRDHLTEATADVERACSALAAIGLGHNPDLTVCTEYPVAMLREQGVLLSGFVDLLLSDASTVTVIDFKTDRPLDGDLVVAYPRYTRQLRLYGEMLRVAQIVGARQLRLGVLLTATGELRWLN